MRNIQRHRGHEVPPRRVRVTISDDDKQKARTLVEFIGVLEKKSYSELVVEKDLETRDGVIMLNCPAYAKEVTSFMETLYRIDWIVSDYPEKEAFKHIGDVDYLSTATFEDIRTLLTAICRGERFCDGYWADVIVSARLLTVMRTCWLQKRNPLEFLVEAISSYRTGSPAPSLLMQNAR